jgi:transposase-like protein
MTKRGPQCTVCRHREHAAIDLGLARGVSLGALARRYGVGPDSLYRHRLNHLPPQLQAKLLAGPDIEGVDLDRLREVESQSLLMNLVSLRNRLFASLDVAEEAGDGNMLARISGQLHRNMELVGKLLGDLSTGNTTTNILIQPAYVELRVALVGALAAYPDARQAVAAVLHTIEHKAAADIAADTRVLAQ